MTVKLTASSATSTIQPVMGQPVIWLTSSEPAKRTDPAPMLIWIKMIQDRTFRLRSPNRCRMNSGMVVMRRPA